MYITLPEDTTAENEVIQVGHRLDPEEINEDGDEEGSPDLATQLTAQLRAISHNMTSIKRTTINIFFESKRCV